MCSEAGTPQLFAAMGSDDTPIDLGSFDECDEFLKISGIVPSEGIIAPFEDDGVEVPEDSW